MRPHVLLPLLLAFLPFAPGAALAAPASWSEAQAVDAFLARSPQVKAVRRLVQSAEAEVVAAGIWANPTLDLGREQVISSGGPAEQHRLGVQLPWGVAGKRELRQAIARAGLLAAEARVRHQVFLLSQDVRAAFARAADAEARVRLLDAHRMTFGRLTRIADARKKAGEGAGYDTMRLQLAESDVQAQLAQARASALEARGRLAGLLGLSLDGELQEAPSKPVPASETLVSRALAGRADLSALSAEREQAERALRLAERVAWADPSVALGLKQTNEPTVSGWGYTAGLAWPLPILDRGQAQQAHAEAEIARLDAEREALTARVRAEVPALRAALVERLAVAERFERGAFVKMPQMLRIAELAYQEGEQGIEALLNAHHATLAARLQRLDLLAESRLAQLELERLVGARLADQ